MPPMLIGLLAQLPSILGGIFGGAKQKRLAKMIHAMDPTYQVSQYAKDQLSTAQNAYNGRMAGATNAEQNIFTNEANQFANIDRNATDSSQALALAGGIGGQTGDALNQLGVAEGQNKQSMLGNLNAAFQNMSNEEKMVYQDKLRKYNDAIKAKEDLMRSGMTNQQNAFNQIGSIGSLYASGLFGSKEDKNPNKWQAAGNIPSYGSPGNIRMQFP